MNLHEEWGYLTFSGIPLRFEASWLASLTSEQQSFVFYLHGVFLRSGINNEKLFTICVQTYRGNGTEIRLEDGNILGDVEGIGISGGTPEFLALGSEKAVQPCGGSEGGASRLGGGGCSTAGRRCRDALSEEGNGDDSNELLHFED